MLLGHELLDDNIMKVTHQLLQRQSQDEGSRAPSMRRICRSNQWGFQLVTTCDDSVDQKFWCHFIWKIHVCSLNYEFEHIFHYTLSKTF